MSEKTQKTAAGMRLKMIAHYGDEPHKHNKDHLHFAPHHKLELHKSADKLMGPQEMLEGHEHWTSKKIQDFKNRKTRKRLDKGRFH